MAQAVATLKVYQEEERLFEEMCKTLPDDVAASLMSEREKRQEEKFQHQRNLEVAREGRSRTSGGIGDAQLCIRQNSV